MIGRAVEVRHVTSLVYLVLTLVWRRAWCLHAVAVCAGTPDSTLTDKRNKGNDSELRANRKAKRQLPVSTWRKPG